MNEKTTESNSVSRRKALQVLGAGMIVPSVLAACQQQEAAKPAAKKEPMKKEGSATKKAEKAEKAEPKKEEAPAAEMAKAEGGELNCNDPSDYDAQSAQMRKTLQYVEQTQKEGKMCSNCMQWKPPEEEGACGGCKLFTGPVNPNGYCLSYAPMQS